MKVYCTIMSATVTYALYSTGHPPVSPSLSSASTFAPAFTRAKMASALPEGQEALQVESACSENTQVGGQSQPVSSNTTEVRHTQLWGCQHHTVYYADRRCVNTTRDCKALMHTVQSRTTVPFRLSYLGRSVIVITRPLTLRFDVKEIRSSELSTRLFLGGVSQFRGLRYSVFRQAYWLLYEYLHFYFKMP